MMRHKNLNDNLIVVINPAPQKEIKDAFPGYKLMDDYAFYNILNGEQFVLTTYNLDSLDALMLSIEKGCEDGEKIVIHTFNPLIVNFLEIHDKEELSLERSARRFAFYTDKNDFIPALKIPSLVKKLDFMSVGEAVCDSYCESMQESWNTVLNK